MGAGNSKPAQSQYVFAADSPVSFSQSVVDSLQNSPETDSTRQRNQELHIQTRVTAELERIRDEEAQRLAQLTERMTPATLDDDSSSSSSPSLTEKIAGAVLPEKKKERSHDSVSKEVMELREKLERRRGLEKQDPAVDKAKDGLVQCLRLNDRRPLDCWKEVQEFKVEVAKLEQKFVDRALR